MLYREIIAVCSRIHTKHINTLCGQNVECLHVKPDYIYIVTSCLTYCNLKFTPLHKPFSKLYFYHITFQTMPLHYHTLHVAVLTCSVGFPQ